MFSSALNCANKAKLSSPVAMRCATVVRAGSVGMLTSIVQILLIPIDQAIGTPIAINTKNDKTRISTSRILGFYSGMN